MPENNFLARLAFEKKEKINELISRFLGHLPTEEDKKYFNIMHHIRESEVYYKGILIGKVKSEAPDEDSLI